MPDYTLQNYWTLTSAHRHGDEDALIALELMASGSGRDARLAEVYIAGVKEKEKAG